MNLKAWVCGLAALCCFDAAHAMKMYASDPSYYGTLYELDPISKSIVRQTTNGAAASVSKMAAHPTYPYLYAAISPYESGQYVNGGVRVINTISGLPIGHFRTTDLDHRYRPLTVSADGLRLYAAVSPISGQRQMTERGTLVVFDLHLGQPFAPAEVELMRVTGMGLNLTGIATGYIGGMNKVFISDDELHALHIINADAGQLRSTTVFGNNVHASDVVVVGTKAYVLSDNMIFVIDVNTEAWIDTIDFSVHNVASFGNSFTVEGSKLVIPGRQASDQQAIIVIYDLVTQNVQTIVATPEYNFFEPVAGPIAGDGVGGFFQASFGVGGGTIFHGSTTTPAMDGAIFLPSQIQSVSALAPSTGGVGQCSRK